MARVRVEFIGFDENSAVLKAAPKQAERALKQGLWRAGQFIRRIIVDGIRSPPKTGRLYKRRSVTHQASAEGEWPAADTGNLMRGVQSKNVPNAIAVDIDSTSAYGPALEFKAPSEGGRPFMSRGYDEGEQGALEIIEDTVAAILPTDGKATRR
ncbi:MAG: hypothetical protein NW206_19895 [Hyphomonadaceae bacterium]|nr:hypothetical protein [Hyphomonadaceae bacterium]